MVASIPDSANPEQAPDAPLQPQLASFAKLLGPALADVAEMPR